MILFKAGYFVNLIKSCLTPERVKTYLGIECNSIKGIFSVPQERIVKYLPKLCNFLSLGHISFADLESLVGKLQSLECAVIGGMWFTREQYRVLASADIPHDSCKKVRESYMIQISEALREEWAVWESFLIDNRGAPWKTMLNVFCKADVYSDASGKRYGGTVTFPGLPTLVTAGEFDDDMIKKDIQVKEGEALLRTIDMLVASHSDLLKGKVLNCKVDNQSLKLVYDRNGTSKNKELNDIGKKLFWIQRAGGFYIRLEYVNSALNRADHLTRSSPLLETKLDRKVFLQIWKAFGPFEWDLMASHANVQCSSTGEKLLFFSRFYEKEAQGVDIFSQNILQEKGLFCFPPKPVIHKLLMFLRSQRVKCVLVIPEGNFSWVNMLRIHTVKSMTIAEPRDSRVFSVISHGGKKMPVRFQERMLAVLVDFSKSVFT
jgi:hypothetical protein